MNMACVEESEVWLGWTMGTYWEKVTPGSSKRLKANALGRHVFAQAVLSLTCQPTSDAFSPIQS